MLLNKAVRPDGCSIHIDPKIIHNLVKEIRDQELEIYKGQIPDEYSSPDDERNPIKIKCLDHDLVQILKEKGYYRAYREIKLLCQQNVIQVENK